MRILLVLITLLHAMYGNAQELTTRFERSGGDESAPYLEVISFYRTLDKEYGSIQMEEAGATDASYPLHVVYYSKDRSFDISQWKRQGKVILLINNGIHPGEPDGIDASMMLMRDAANGKLNMPDHVVLAVIPVFNIGGALNRGSYSRANQNGPKEYGFRGNAQNLDLNRDFIKLDAKETQSLIRLFHKLDPDIFIDNHVSNGADYQHVMTLLSVNPEKQGYYMGKYLQNALGPAIYEDMKAKGYDLVPYVNHWGNTPDSGWAQFYEPPRFASGFAALFQTFAFVPETHMLKPYKQRVRATYELMKSFIFYAEQEAEAIKGVRDLERKVLAERREFTLDWKVNKELSTMIEFKGYEAAYKPSEISGKPRLYYDRTKPYTKEVPFYNEFDPAATAMAPQYYIIPGAWQKVISRLKWNGVKMRQLEEDTTMMVTMYRISNFDTRPQPYEGHYLHSNVEYTRHTENVTLPKGSYMIRLDQKAKRYLLETLEPNAPDAFFAWGFFDAVLQQKEYFSDYVFEDEAAELLRKDPELKKQFEEKKKTDAKFARDPEMQLDYIYRHSPYYEPTHMRYPVYRIE